MSELKCADCRSVIGQDVGPKDGWQLEDGRTVCHSCCVADTKKQLLMSGPNIAEKYYGKLKALGEETIADFVWQQAETIKQLLAALERGYNRLDRRGADAQNVSSVKSILKQAIANAKGE